MKRKGCCLTRRHHKAPTRRGCKAPRHRSTDCYLTTFGRRASGQDHGVTEGLALAGGWLIYACMLAVLTFVLLRRPG